MMSESPHSPANGFRISMLINDTRYRSLTFQAIAAIVLALTIAYLLNNLSINLRAAGLDISFDFLGHPAGYDINQRVIEYTSQSSHLTASIVGLLNTLIVAVLACITATVLGVIAGVLRLSNNWLIAKIMSVYVEIFRNVPVLIWILIIFTFVSSVLPAPKAFRGNDPSAFMLFDVAAFTNRGAYVPAPTLSNPILGNGYDWLLVLVVLTGSYFGMRALRRRASKTQEATGKRPTTWHIQLAIWVVPAAILLTILGFGWSVPELKGFNFKGGWTIRGALIALWLSLAVYTGAFIAENVRAGILAVSKGQTEAAAALGMRPGPIMSLVVLPQALRVIIPPLISHYLNITKNSSLAIAVGYMDITATLGGITLNQTGRAIETVLLVMAFYLTISLTISAILNLYNKSIALKER